MWKSGICLTAPTLFFPHGGCGFLKVFQQALWSEKRPCSFSQIVFPHSTTLVEKFFGILKARIDIRCNIPNVVLEGGITLLQLHFHLTDSVEDGGVILAEFLANVGQRKVGQLSDQILGHLPGFGRSLIFQSTAQGGLVDRVELADLADDQTGGGQGVALYLEHFVNGPGNIGQVQRHVVEVPVSHDFLDRSFNLPHIVGHINGNIVANIVRQV